MEENKVEISVEDIRNCCNTITSKILPQMRGDIVSNLDKKSIAEGPVLYRWWFPEDFVKLLNDDYKCKLQEQLEDVESKSIDNNVYYALYFGKSKNGLTRFKAHTSGNSTLRRTLDAICKELTRIDIKNLINDCYFEWVEVDNESLLECLEAMCIVYGKYPLNIEGNPYCQDWIVKARKIKSINDSCL